MKCVIVLDVTLPIGLLTNTAAALGLSLGNHVNGLIGPDVIDFDGKSHKGITAVPIPILAIEPEGLNLLYTEATKRGKELVTIGFSKTAQRCHSYDLYIKEMAGQLESELDFLGVCLYGPQKSVNQLCGQLKLLR